MCGHVKKPLLVPVAYRLVIADDHRLLREGIKLILAKRPEFTVTGEVEDGLELLEMLSAGPEPDILIVDISMPRLNGLEAVREIRRTNGKVRIIILTMHKDEDLLWQALMAGADGYILKEHLATELFPALETVLKLGVHVSPGFAQQLQHAWLKTFIAVRGEHPMLPLSSSEVDLLHDLKSRVHSGARKSLRHPHPEKG